MRDVLVTGLEKCNIRFGQPAGAYYVMCDATSFARPGEGESQLVRRLLQEAGVGVVPGQCFYGSTDPTRPLQIRIAFAKGEDSVAEGARRLHSYLGMD